MVVTSTTMCATRSVLVKGLHVFVVTILQHAQIMTTQETTGSGNTSISASCNSRRLASLKNPFSCSPMPSNRFLHQSCRHSTLSALSHNDQPTTDEVYCSRVCARDQLVMLSYQFQIQQDELAVMSCTWKLKRNGLWYVHSCHIYNDDTLTKPSVSSILSYACSLLCIA